MKSVRFLVSRVFLLIAFITTSLYLLYGQERAQGVPIARNAAWNDLLWQINISMDDSPHETLGKEIVLIQKFLKEHECKGSLGIYDINVFKAIDQVRARLQKADQDLEAIRKEPTVLPGKLSNSREVIHGTYNHRSLLRMPSAHYSRRRLCLFQEARFKTYQFFHRRFRTGDCWEKHFETASNTLASRWISRTVA